MTPARLRLLIILLIIAGILLAAFFGMRALRAFGEFRRHGPPPFPPPAEAFESEAAETDVELIRDWMTVPYIAKTYHIHPRVLFEALNVPPKGNEEKSLLQLNEEFFPQTPGVVLELVKAVIRANQPASTATTVPSTP